MIRLTDERWERIRDHFPEENIGDGALATRLPLNLSSMYGELIDAICQGRTLGLAPIGSGGRCNRS